MEKATNIIFNPMQTYLTTELLGSAMCNAQNTKFYNQGFTSVFHMSVTTMPFPELIRKYDLNNTIAYM